MNSLLYALRPLASDFLPTIAFAVLAAMHVDVRIAAGGALGVSILQMLVQRLLKRPIPLLQLASLGLVIVFGAVSIVANDARFLMIKPSIIYVAVGVVMLKRGWMLRYLPPIASGHGDALMVAWGYAWAGLMFVSAAANLVVAWTLPALWPAYLATVPLASKLVLFAIQYASMRFVIRRKILAEMAQPSPAPLAA
ncbi:MAG: inner membrane-spanning protein YciB [Phenylobacterium sp.]